MDELSRLTKVKYKDMSKVERALMILWGDYHGHENTATEAMNELATLRMERDEAVRILEDANEWLKKNRLEHTAHQKQIADFLAKVKP